MNTYARVLSTLRRHWAAWPNPPRTTDRWETSSMRLHTDLTEDMVRIVVKGWGRNPDRADITIGRLSTHGTRSGKANGLELQLAGNGREGGAFGGLGFTTATWDEYGIILAKLYDLDPEMIVGSPSRPTYESRDDFHYLTSGRYEDLRPQDACRQHRWKWVPGYGTCTRCEAEIVRRGG